MRAVFWGILAIGLLITSFQPLPAFSQQTSSGPTCAVDGLMSDVRPDTSGPATKVKIGLRMADLREINDVDQTITVDVAIRMSWTDARLASLAGCRVSVDKVWFPEPVLMNSGRVFNRWPEQVGIEEGGRVVYLQRFAGTFSSYHSLENFPFDSQSIRLTVFPLHWSEEKLLYVRDETFEGMSKTLNISDWRVNSVETEVGTYWVEALDADRSAYAFFVNAKRHASYYVWKIILPICLIVAMSWCVFWIDSRQFGTRLGLSATSVLTMVAFIFTTTSILPRLGYFTLLDMFTALSTVIVFLALLQTLVTGYLASRGHERTAARIDFGSRFLFPAVFTLFCYWHFSAIPG